MQDNLDNITLNSIPLAEALPEIRDKRIINIRDKAIQAMEKGIKGAKPIKKAPWRQHQKMCTKDFKPGKGRHLTKKEIEEEIMERDIKKINAEGLTGAECIYVAFKEMDWRELRTPEITFATDKAYASISALLSTMQKNGMLVRREKEPKKFYYKVAEDCQGLGRVGWSNMVKEMQNTTRKDNYKKKKSKELEKVSKNPIAPVATVKTEEVNMASELAGDKQVARNVRSYLEKLNLAIGNAEKRGLVTEITIVHVVGGIRVEGRIIREL
jgi:hypothetical protein